MLSSALPGVIQGQRTRIVDSAPPTVSGVAVSNLLFIYYRVLFQAIDRIEVEIGCDCGCTRKLTVGGDVGRADEVDPGRVGWVEFFPELPVSRVEFDAIYQDRHGWAIDINALAIPRQPKATSAGFKPGPGLPSPE
jgi:hypothetical protein